MGRVLLVKLGAIGDVVMLLPAARALHERGEEVEWLCGQQVAPLLALYPWIRTVVADETALLRGSFRERASAMVGLWRHFAGLRYDWIATLYYDRRYALLTRTARTARRIALSAGARSRRILPGRSYPDEFARVLLEMPDDVRPESMLPVRPERLPAAPIARTAAVRIVLVPAGAHNLVREDALRRWPVESFAALAERLLAAGYEVLLSGGPGDRWASESFRSLAVIDCIGRHTLVETVALFESSDVVVTPDTGPLHLAGLTRASIVAIFGPTSPHNFLPRRARAVALWGGAEFACRPCYDGRNYAPCHRNECVRQISVERVLAEVQRQLRGRGIGALSRSVFLGLQTDAMPGAAGPEIFHV